MNIGTNIYHLRKEKKLTQAQLAEKLGVSEQAVSKWENGCCLPDVSLFPLIADIFGVSIDRIFGYHKRSYADEVEEIMKKAEAVNKAIRLCSEVADTCTDTKHIDSALNMLHRIYCEIGEYQKALETVKK